ncbi:MAG: hypothetical protein ACFFCE_11155 [Promethearchaeota archaeon]
MINERFRINWLKILNFNENREIIEDPKKIQKTVRIPLTPITLNANLLYYFFEVLYPKFINDQQNILDVIISEKEKKNKVLGLYLYKTKKAGIHQSIEVLPKGLIKIKSLEIRKIDEIFNKIQANILKEKGIRISSIRLFKNEALEMINKYCEKIEEISTHDFFEQFFDLIQKLFVHDLILIYPAPIVSEFFKNVIKLLGKIRFKNIFKFINEILPEFNISFLIEGNKTKIVIHLQHTNLKSGKSELEVEFFTPNELDFNTIDLDVIDSLSIIKNKLDTEKVYYLNQNDIISFLSNFFELFIPLKKESLKLLIQKFLFGYRSFEKHWNMVPHPRIYNTLIRFLIRILGFNINFRKLSHWAIPEVIFNYLDFYFGLNSRILFIITDVKGAKNLKISRQSISKNACKKMILAEIEASTLTSLEAIGIGEIFSNNSLSLNSISSEIAQKFGKLSAIIIIDKILLENILKNYIFNHSKFSFFPRFKTLSLLKNERYFMMYPEFPFFKLIKKKRSMSLMTILLPILIDKHEF